MSDRQCSYQHPQQLIKIQSESGTEDLHYAALYESTPEEFKLYAEKELNETEEKKAEGIKKLREFAIKENASWLDDYHLIVIMRACKYDTKKYESKLKRFLRIRRETIDQVKVMDSKVINDIIDDIVFGMLPYRDKYGKLIIFLRPSMQLDRYSVEQILTCCVCAFMFVLTFPLTSICGLTFVGNCNYHSQFQIFCILKNVAHTLLHIFINFPIRCRKIHVLNESQFIRWFYKIMKPFLPRKFTMRIAFYGTDFKNLHKHVHPDLLPTDFGGNLGPITNVCYKEKLLSFIQKLKTEDKY